MVGQSWPSWKTTSDEYQAYIYFLLDPRNADHILSNYQLFKKEIFYVGESKKGGRIIQHAQGYNRTLNNGDLFDRKESRMDKIKNHPADTLHLKLPVPTKELAENLEYILVERFKGQSTNCDHGKCTMPDVYLLNSVNACAMADISWSK